MSETDMSVNWKTMTLAMITAVPAIIGVINGAGAATIGRDTLARKLLDVCVYRQYEVKDIDRASMIEKCRCSGELAIKSFEGDSFDEPRSGGLTGPQDQALRAAVATCFEPKAKKK
jgi:hypothetical protein